MQFQADIINVPVVKPAVMETTAIGAAFAAGLAVGVWKDLDEIKSLWAVAETYEPKMASPERKSIGRAGKAVEKSGLGRGRGD
jgi:glycerol kinase